LMDSHGILRVRLISTEEDIFLGNFSRMKQVIIHVMFSNQNSAKLSI